jgi:translation initiation factor IF-2
MDKVRVYELARDIGITSPQAIQLLKDKLQIRVKSASSTIEEDVAIKLKRLIRLEGSGAIGPSKAEAKVAEPTQSKEEQARSTGKARAERARKALLAEFEEEERAEERRKQAEERAAREREETERLAAEQAAREEAARLAAVLEEQEALQVEVDERARVDSGLVEDVPAAPGAEVAEVAEADEAERRPAEAIEAPPIEPEAERAEKPAPASAPRVTSPPPLPPAAPTSPAGPAGEAAASAPSMARGQGVRATQTRGFVPGPTSTVIRTRPPAPTRAGMMKPIPPPPRPAAPIKTVHRRRPDAKPRTKESQRKARATAAEVKEQAIPEPKVAEAAKPAPLKVFRKITLTEGATVKELAEKMEVKHKDLIKSLMNRGILATINQTLETDLAVEVAREFGAEAEILSFEEDVFREETVEEKPEDLVARAPVVTVMGHVDHGKTSLLDAIRKTKVVEKEAGGITQHIGAYKVAVNGRSIVFLDTPGHEAFTMMRARGARVTDLVILVVAADDGVMPQTVEAIDHAKEAGVPLMVVVNKIDKPDANSELVKKQLADLGLLPEDWGGSTVFVEVSAKERQGLDLMLEMILLVSDILELKANPKRAAMGTVLEAKIDKGKGPVAHVLVQNGTAQVGDSFIAGAVHGKIRAMIDDRGHKVKRVDPATPIEISGLTSLPQAWDQFQVILDSTKARQIGEFRQQKLKERQQAGSARLTLDQLHQQVEEGTVKELRIVLKADVQGSVEVLSDTLTKLSGDKVKVKIIRAGAGAVTEADVHLASVSNAIIIGFNVRPQKTVEDLAEKENIDVRLHTVIYNVTDEIKKALAGLLEPTFKEITVGRAEVRNTFKVPKVGTIAGCYVTEGKVVRSGDVRLLRDSVIIYEGKVGSLRRFKDDATEVKQGFECGIGIAGYNDVKIGDVIEAFSVEKVQAASV